MEKQDELKDRLAYLIERDGKNKSQIERDTGIKRQSIIKYLKGSMPSEYNVQVLADYFHVSTEYLRGRSDYDAVKDIQDICEFTGLSANTIKHIQEAKERGILSGVDKMLSSDKWFYFFMVSIELMNVPKDLYMDIETHDGYCTAMDENSMTLNILSDVPKVLHDIKDSDSFSYNDHNYISISETDLKRLAKKTEKQIKKLDEQEENEFKGDKK